MRKQAHCHLVALALPAIFAWGCGGGSVSVDICLNVNCDVGEVCDNDVCVLVSECTTDEDCLILGEICVNSDCIAGCRSLD